MATRFVCLMSAKHPKIGLSIHRMSIRAPIDKTHPVDHIA